MLTYKKQNACIFWSKNTTNRVRKWIAKSAENKLIEKSSSICVFFSIRIGSLIPEKIIGNIDVFKTWPQSAYELDFGTKTRNTKGKKGQYWEAKRFLSVFFFSFSCNFLFFHCFCSNFFFTLFGFLQLCTRRSVFDNGNNIDWTKPSSRRPKKGKELWPNVVETIYDFCWHLVLQNNFW